MESGQPSNELSIDSWSRRLAEADACAVNCPEDDIRSSVAVVTEVVEQSADALRHLCREESVNDGAKSNGDGGKSLDEDGKSVADGGSSADVSAATMQEKAAAFDADLWEAVQSCCRKLTSPETSKQCYALYEDLAHLYRQYLESLPDILISENQHSNRVLCLAELLSQNTSRFSDVTSKGIFFLFSAGTRCITSGLLADASSLLSVTLKFYWTWCGSQGVSKADAGRLAYSMVSNAALSFEYQRNFRSAAACRGWLSKVPSQPGDQFHDDAVWALFRQAVLAMLDADNQGKDYVRSARASLDSAGNSGNVNANKRGGRACAAAAAILDCLEGSDKTFEVISEYIHKVYDADVEKGPVGAWKANGLGTIHQCMDAVARLSATCANLMKERRAIGAWCLTIANLNWAAFHQALAKAPRLIQGCPFTISAEDHLQSALNIFNQQSLPMLTPAAIATSKIKPLLAMAKHCFAQENFAKAKSLAETALSIRSAHCPSGHLLGVARESLRLLLNVALQTGDAAGVEMHCSQVDRLNDTPNES